MFDLGLIHIERLIVHEVPRRYIKSGPSTSNTILSEVESPLQTDVRNFFQERLVATLRFAYEVEFDPSTESRVPNLVDDLVTKSASDFVAASQELANLLYANQDGVNPGGLLTVMDLSIGERSGIAIVKLEKEEGARVRQAKVDGHATFNVTHLRDLMLTRKTKVFKVGLFAPYVDHPGIEGLVSDTQKGAGTAVAFFFLRKYLGCRLREVPEVTTKKFFDAVEAFINEDVDTPQEKANYQIALLAELQNSRDSISPEAFADANIATEERSRLLQRLSQAGISAQSFVKNRTLIEPSLHRIQWNFESGIVVIAAPETVGHQVQVQDIPDRRMKMEITDRLRDVKGHR